MQLRPYEIVVLLKQLKGTTYTKISNTIGYSDSSSLRRCIYNNGGAKMQDGFKTLLQKMLCELKEMPWDEKWRHPMVELHTLDCLGYLAEIERNFAAIALMAPHLGSCAPRSERLGVYYFAGRYHMAFASNPRRIDNQNAHKELAVKYYNCVMEELDDKNLLESVFITKCIGNIVSLNWNTVPHKKRDTIEFRALIEDLEFFARMDEHIKRFPRLHTAPFNALAIASGLNLTERFEYLYNALITSHPNHDDDIEFDEDFDNFKKWQAKQKPSAA